MQNSQTTSKYASGYIESDIALAATAADWGEVELLVNEMSPTEARGFRRALLEVAGYLEIRGRGENI